MIEAKAFELRKQEQPAKRKRLPKLVVFDFDGVLTDNRVWVFQDGREAVACDRRDGLAFDALRREGITALILSTERNPVVAARAFKLNVPVIHGSGDKRAALRSYCRVQKIRLKDVLYVGNDLNDWLVMGIVGLPVCPADAHPKIKAMSKIVLSAHGGAGVAREIAEQLLKLEIVGPKKEKLSSRQE
ncbi:MAG: HAD hydrolase family protein [Verrucomicrobiales bacterium]|nr:HAD hydrolase family protein [Verrucomicrobiales bacterium]